MITGEEGLITGEEGLITEILTGIGVAVTGVGVAVAVAAIFFSEEIKERFATRALGRSKRQIIVRMVMSPEEAENQRQNKEYWEAQRLVGKRTWFGLFEPWFGLFNKK